MKPIFDYSIRLLYSNENCTFVYTFFGDPRINKDCVAIYECEGERAEYPAEITGLPVVEICKEDEKVAPHKCKIAIFPEGIKRIWPETFADSQILEEVVLPMSLEVMGIKSFAYCPNLKKITLPRKNLMAIPRAFQHSPNIEKICTCDTKEEYTLDRLISLFDTSVLAITDVETNNNKLGHNARKIYQDIKDWGWYDDVKELM